MLMCGFTTSFGFWKDLVKKKYIHFEIQPNATILTMITITHQYCYKWKAMGK